MHAFRCGLVSAALLLAGCAGVPMQSVEPPPAMAPVPVTPAAQPVIATPAAATSTATPAPDVVAAPPQSTHLVTSPEVAVTKEPRSEVAGEAPARRPVRHQATKREPSTATRVTRAMPSGSALSGHVTLATEGGQRSGASDVSDTLVYFVPESGNIPPSPDTFTVFTQNRTFDPAAMAIPSGSTVTFTNLDEVRHNEFSVTPGSAFNLGYQAPGQKTTHVFAHPGLVLVGCLVHRAMELDLLVVPTTFVTRVAANGDFRLRDLPPGPGLLYTWNPRGRLVTRKLTIPASIPIDERVTITRPAVAMQLDLTLQP